ncbi:MAG: hypothetical protein RBT81_04125 [Gammaproteobacteria bacterium]|jgi:hypothetical protein|nr:hypothetical protein [Gammaproteobacteria bacterium]
MDPLDALADIEMLAPPSATGAAAALLIAASVLAAVAWRRWRLRQRTPAAASMPAEREAMQRLAALRAAWETGTVGDREAAYRLCALLRIGLGLPALDPEGPPAGVDAESWRHWLRALQRVRYQHEEHPLTGGVFTLADSWLKRGDHA